MRYKVRYGSQARQDLNSIYKYIRSKLKNPDAAKRVASKITQEIASLELFPFRYPIIKTTSPVLERIGLRHFLVGNYTVYYLIKPQESEVVIADILYSRRDVEKKLLEIEYDDI